MLKRQLAGASAVQRDVLDPAEVLELVGPSALAARGTDRRTVMRLSFPHRQSLAPYYGGCLPSRASFKDVLCCDISQHGFSFLAASAPDFDGVLVALGIPPELTYMTARVASRILISDGLNPLYRIGCRFTGRLN
jgi:hypothetical protein